MASSKKFWMPPNYPRASKRMWCSALRAFFNNFQKEINFEVVRACHEVHRPVENHLAKNYNIMKTEGQTGENLGRKYPVLD